jgi:alanyl aminopeptidase
MKILVFSTLLIGVPLFATPSFEPPKLRLDSSAVQPLRYAVDLTIIPDRDTFRGVVDIDLDVRNSTETIWLNAVGITIEKASIGIRGGIPLQVKTVPGGDQFVGLSVVNGSVSGKCILHIEYQGNVSRHSSAGIFELKEDRDWYVYSQFEPTDARRAFPCFDEPGFKVPWQMTLHVPKEDMAVSNTPIQSESGESNGMKVVRFKPTPPLPSYLVALAVGRFDAVDAGHVGPTAVRVIVPRGKGAQAADAANAIPQLLKLLVDYFGIPFPYAKLDSVVMPISDFAMENAGMITYGESMLLANPSSETVDHKRELAGLCAHEMAHQWFGDLVTTAWWNDTWLNEAFATWMERKIPGEWKPEWHLDVSIVNARLSAMRLDELASARSIRQPIESNDDIANAFDNITYEKGAAVIEMFEHWIGPQKFRAGVQTYLKLHAWGNATASDFEGAMSSVAGQDIAPLFNSFLDQPGVPVISVALKCGSRPKLELTQKRSEPIGSHAQPQVWHIPVCVAYQAGAGVRKACSVVDSPKAEIELAEATACPGWLLANDDESGYYQVAYEGDLLKNVLADGGSHLNVPERVGLLGDLNFLASAQEISVDTALEQVPVFSRDPAPQVVQAAADVAAVLKSRNVPPELRDKGAKFIRQQFGAQAKALGWIDRPGDNDDTRLLRQDLVPFVASAGEQKDLIDQAEQLAREWLKNRRGIDPEMAGPVLDVAAEFGDRDLFNLLRNAAIRERDHSTREQLVDALGSFRDPTLANDAMDLLVSNEFDPRESFYALLFGPLAYGETRDLPFEFLKRHIDELLKILPREVGEDYAAALPEVGKGFCDVQHRDEIGAFFADRVKDYTGGPRILKQTIENIDLCISAREALAPQLTAFLDKY